MIIDADSSAAFSVPAYTFKGIYKELRKHLGASDQNYIIAARTAQGYDDWGRSSEEDRLDAVRKWHDIQLELSKEKHQVKVHKTPPPCRFLKTRHMSHDDGKKTAHDKKARNKFNVSKQSDSNSPEIGAVPAPLQHAQTYPRASSFHSDPAEFEQAIQLSVAATSKGNPEEDDLVEKAIRASVAELQQASKEGDDEKALKRAIQASVAEAARNKKDSTDYSEQLHSALYRSIQQRPALARRSTHIADLDFDDSGVDTEDDENIKFALESSKQLQHTRQRDQELERVLDDSKKLHEEHKKGLEKQMTEEEIVVEYVKKQSLAEEKYRDSMKSEHQKSVSQKDKLGKTLERAT